MARPASRFPTEFELQVLQLLWQLGESSVMSVRDALAEQCDRDIARTSVVTTLNVCLLYTSPSPRDLSTSRMPSSA